MGSTMGTMMGSMMGTMMVRSDGQFRISGLQLAELVVCSWRFRIGGSQWAVWGW